VRALKLASWNMEHLTDTDGEGCRPRKYADYQLLFKQYSESEAQPVAGEAQIKINSFADILPDERQRNKPPTMIFAPSPVSSHGMVLKLVRPGRSTESYEGLTCLVDLV
jgi:hypothetical protein